MLLYHYTTKNGYETITRTGQFARSSPFTTIDSAYGDGWYFTDLDPEKCDPVILSHCWKNINVTDRIQHYLKFEINNSIVIKCREHVFMVSDRKSTRLNS